MKKKENIYNVPNTVTLSRVIISAFILSLIFFKVDLNVIVIAFIVGAITDFLDGHMARKLNQVTEFGRKFDIVADRILLLSTVIAIVIWSRQSLFLNEVHFIEILLIMTREILAAPFAIYAFFSRIGIPHARFIGKLTTTLQGIAFPLLVLNLFSHIFDFSVYFVLLTAVVGLVSATRYMQDVFMLRKLHKKVG